MRDQLGSGRTTDCPAYQVETAEDASPRPTRGPNWRASRLPESGVSHRTAASFHIGIFRWHMPLEATSPEGCQEGWLRRLER